MQSQLTTPSRSLWNYRALVMVFLTACILFACATVNRDKFLDRNAVPELRTDVPANASEIRELKFHGMVEEEGHKDVHLKGQLFTKSQVGSSTQIRPCSGCVIGLRGTNDTTNRANLTTQPDGYFEFNGAIDFNTIRVTIPNHNQLEISNVNLTHGGISTIKLIVAAGSSKERFMVSKNENAFTWTKTQ
jgi:hypothetical protein